MVIVTILRFSAGIDSMGVAQGGMRACVQVHVRVRVRVRR